MFRKEHRQHTMFLTGFTLILWAAAVWGIQSGSPAAESAAAFVTEGAADGRTRILLRPDGSQAGGPGVEIFGNRIQITRGGTYVITGSLTEGQIHVAAGDDETVTLVLAGAEVVNASKAAILIECAGKAEIVLEDGTKNRVQSGEIKAAADEITEAAEDASEESKTAGGKGAVYAKCDLTIWGTGELEVLGCLNDGIRTTGNLTVNGGNFRIESQGDAVQSESALEITGGSFQVTTGGGSGNASGKTGETEMSGEFPGRDSENAFREKGRADIPGEFQGKEPSEHGEGPKPGEEPPDWHEGQRNMDSGPEFPGGMQPDARMDEEETTASTKGFKSKTRMYISGGSFLADTLDDTFHCDGDIRITGGSFEISSGDDGIHADTELHIDNGTIQIKKSYEGLEANQILIKGGDISITASDDGVNAYGGGSGFGTGMAESAKTTEEMPNLSITGGSLSIDADGDGLDSNGNILVEGGEITVDGPSGSGNGAIDSGSENGGTCRINSGTILAVGSSGMAETFDETSGQNSFCCYLKQSFEAGEEIRIEDSNGTQLCSHTTAKSGNSVVFSSPALTLGETYTVYAGNQSVQIQLESISTVYGEQAGSFDGRGGQRKQFP